MNALYHVAVIEGYLSNTSELPASVKEAIEFLKKANAPVVATVAVAKPKKKRQMTAEQRQKMNEHMKKMWEVRKQKMEERKALAA